MRRPEPDDVGECIIDLTGASDEERIFLVGLKRRIDTVLRGEAKLVTMAEANAFAQGELRKRRAARSPTLRPPPRR